ncbi:MAG: hypothetical protein EX258_05235, partial [Sphingomonadaceae bacterium]
MRAAVEAVLRIDATFAEIAAGTSEPQVGLIRLAWWREALERLDHSDPPAEPRLSAISEHCLPRGITGAMISGIEDGYVGLFETSADWHRVGKGGSALFGVIANLLGEDDHKLNAAGALTMLARTRNLAPGDAKSIALEHLTTLRGHRFAKPLRPLTNLARLAARDFLRAEPEPEA